MDIPTALAAAKTRIEALPTYGVNPAAVYVHPAETVGLERITVYPTVILAEALEPERQWVPVSFGTGTDYWHIAVTVYLAAEVVEIASPAAAANLALHAGWPEALASTFAASSTLAGTVDRVGDGDRLMRYLISGVRWNGRMYWGLHAVIPVAQTHVQTMAP